MGPMRIIIIQTYSFINKIRKTYNTAVKIRMSGNTGIQNCSRYIFSGIPGIAVYLFPYT